MMVACKVRPPHWFIAKQTMRKTKAETTNKYSEHARNMTTGIRQFVKQAMKRHRIKISDIAAEMQQSESNTYYLLSDRANVTMQKMFELISIVGNIAGTNITVNIKEHSAMRVFTTELKAIDPADGILKTWQGPHIQAISYNDARAYCDAEGMGYLDVTGILTKEIDEETGETIDYSNDN